MKRLYKLWISMKTRCYNTHEIAYHRYGGRGIKVCDEWVNNYKAFSDYMIALPGALEPGLTIDRIDNDGDYEPGNVRWVDRCVQKANQAKYKNNTSGLVGVSFFKRDKCWMTFITVRKVRHYLGRHKSIEKALTARNNYIKNNNLTNYKLQTL